MTREEHLLIILAEECSEVSKEVAKSLRFGLGNHYPDDAIMNSEKISQELCDLIAVADMLKEEGFIKPFINNIDIDDKKRKVEHYLRCSQELNKLKEE